MEARLTPRRFDMELHMQWKFYIGDGPEAGELIAKAEEKRKLAFKKRGALMEEYKADGLILSNSLFDHGTPLALGFKKKPDDLAPFKKERKCDDGWYYYPRLSSRAGKELANKLGDPDLVFDRSDFIISSLGLWNVEHGKYVGNGVSVLFASQAAYGLGKVLVKIPYKEGEQSGAVLEKVPAWLREVRESEFLVAQGK